MKSVQLSHTGALLPHVVLLLFQPNLLLFLFPFQFNGFSNLFYILFLSFPCCFSRLMCSIEGGMCVCVVMVFVVFQVVIIMIFWAL